VHKPIAGIHHFHPGHFRPSHRLFELAIGDQGPQALLITCGDLGIDPCTLIPTNFGGLYVLQNAGNLVVPHGVSGADERSCPVDDALGLHPVEDIVVCGHSPCLVMEALIGFGEDGMPPDAKCLDHATRASDRPGALLASRG